MDLFKKSDAVKLKGHHGKYLYAEDDQCTVSQQRNGSKPNAVWTVELDANNSSILKLKSCFGCYLTASNIPFLLGMTGKKVMQMKWVDSESLISWLPIREGFSVKLKTQAGSFLRANGTIPPWRNSVTHDAPHTSLTQEWILWEVEPTESEVQSSDISYQTSSPKKQPSSSIKGLLSTKSLQSLSSQESPRTPESKVVGRTIYYAVADDSKEIPEEFNSEFTFQSQSLDELIAKLKEETGIKENFYACMKNQLNGKLFPLRLHLPPNNAPIYLVVVNASSKLAKTLPGV